MAKCFWCWAPPPCAHLHEASRDPEESLSELRRLIEAHRPAYPSWAEKLKTRWVRWFHAPVEPDRVWCNCGRRHPCRTRIENL